MNTLGKIRIWITIILVVAFYSTQAQIDQKVLTGEVYCINKDYIFRVEGKSYEEDSKVYVCPKNIPVDISILDATSQPPISTFKWTVNGMISTDTNDTIRIQKSDFIGHKLKLEAEFTEALTGNLITLELKLTKKIELKFEESTKNYQYDPNGIQAYIDYYGGTEKIGTPWNFIETGELDVLKVRVNKKKGYYAVNNIMSNDSFLVINDTILSMTPEDITFDFQGSGKNIIEVRGCHETDPELLLFTAQSKMFDIEFFEVCHTDDDIQVKPVGTMVTSPDEICIDGGADMTIDEMWKVNSSGMLVIRKRKTMTKELVQNLHII